MRGGQYSRRPNPRQKSRLQDAFDGVGPFQGQIYRTFQPSFSTAAVSETPPGSSPSSHLRRRMARWLRRLTLVGVLT